MSQVAPAPAAILARPCRVCDGASMAAAADATDSAVLADFERHLRSERGRSDHTTRAYVSDVRQLLSFALDQGVSDLGELSLGDLRSWLGEQADRGAARSTIARHAAAARTFLGWAARTGRIDSDPSLRLVAPRRGRVLPGVLKQREASAMLDVAAIRADDSDPIHVRDRAVLELLYASGIRVGELVALDVDDVDLDQRVARVMGKGAKERMVPFGVPAARALGGWLVARRAILRPRSGPALFLGRSGARSMLAKCGHWCTRCSATCPMRQTSAPTACGTVPPPTCSKVARTCGWSRRSSATPVWRRPRSTPTSRWSAFARVTSRPIRGRDSSRAAAGRWARGPGRPAGRGRSRPRNTPQCRHVCGAQ